MTLRGAVAWWLVACAACGEPDPTETGTTQPTEAFEPGARTVARLNRTQYNNILRDVFGTQRRPADVFPMDEQANGFDNQGEALTTTSTHVELWELAADEVLDEMFGRNDESTVRYHVQAEGPGVSYAGQGMPYGLYLPTGYTLLDGSLTAAVPLDFDGTFSVTILAFGRSALAIPPELSVAVDGRVVETFTVEAELGNAAEYQVEVPVSSGVHSFTLAITNPYDSGFGDRRAVTIDWIDVNGPLDPEGELTPAYAEFIGCGMDEDPDPACAESALTMIGERLWGRPLSAEDLAWAMSLYTTAVAAGETSSWSLQYAIKGLLLSPQFLYHLETNDPASVRQLDGYEVADRLATFLWASAPDAALIAAAKDGSLLAEGGVEAAVDRMFDEVQADALVDSLAAQWFDFDLLDTFVPDQMRYPEWDDEIAASMETEIRLLAADFFLGEDTLQDMLLRQEGWVDARLAEHYDVPFSGDPGVFLRMPNRRVGLLGTAGWLTAHSKTDAPSAVRRGKWILENLLCSAPPPPPPNVESMFMPVEASGSIRQQEEALRADDYCQSCHAAMDPLGYVLYNYDATGADRETDELGYPIDTNVVVSGAAMSDLEDLAAWVAADPRLPRCMVEKTLTYALGRPLVIADGPTVASVTAQFEAGGLTFRALAGAIATTPAFLSRSPLPMAEEE